MTNFWTIAMLLELVASLVAAFYAAKATIKSSPTIIVKGCIAPVIFIAIAIGMFLVLLILNALIGIPLNALSTIRDILP